MRNTRRISGLVLLILLASLIQWPQGKAITPQQQTISITDTHDDLFITETGIGIDSALCHITDPTMDLRSFLVFRELDINFWEPLKNATLRFRTTTTLDFDADSSVTVYGMKYTDLQREGILNPGWVLTVPFTSAYTNYNTSQFYGQTWHEVNVTTIVEELIRAWTWDGDGHAGTETGDAIGFIIVGAEGHDTRWFIDYLYGTPSLASQLVIHWNHEPPPPTDPPDPPEKVDFVEQYGNYTIWRVNGTLDLTDFSYRKAINITGSTAGAKTDYQVKVNVHAGTGTDSSEDVYLDGNAQEDFDDVRFTNSSGIDHLDYWREGVWGAEGQKIVDGDGRGGIATYTNAISPQAIHYVGTYNRTYIVYIDQAYDPNILYYDHPTGVFSSTVQIANNPINDDHGAPTLLIDQNGYIHVFYGCHDSTMKHAKSDSAEDITAWTVQADPTSSATYPISRLTNNGTIYLFYRRTISGTHKVESFVRSDDDGANWGAVTTPVDFGDNYWMYHSQVVIGSDESIHVIWTYYSTVSSKRENIYYAYSTDWGATWKAIDGTGLGVSINKAEADANCLVYDSTGDPAIAYNGWTITGHANDLRLNSSNDPFITLLHGKADNECQFAFAKWTAGSWNVDNITTTGHPQNKATLDYVGSTDVRAYLIAGGAPPSTRYGSLEFWKSVDNGETWGIEEIIVDEGSGESCFPKLVMNYADDLQVIWTIGIATPSDVYAYGDAMSSEAYTLFWVELEDIPAFPNNATIYIYYGNATTGTTSNGPTTFPFFDDFNDDALNATLWTEWLATGSYSESGGILQVTGAGGLWEGIGGKTEYLYYAFRMRAKQDELQQNTVGFDSRPIGGGDVDSGDFSYKTDGNYFRYAVSVDDNNIERTIGLSIPYLSYSVRELLWKAGEVKFYIQNDLVATHTTQTPDEQCSLSFTAKGAGVDVYIDWTLVRKYVSPEPYISVWGAVEEEGDDTYYVADANGTILVDDLDSLDDAEDWIDTYDPDPEDPDPPGWPETGGFTRFRMRLYFLVLGLGCLFGPILFFASGRGTGYYLMCGFIIMLFGIALLMSIGQV